MIAMRTDKPVPEELRLLAEQRGLARALTLFPDAVKAAAARGQTPMAPVPDPAATEPAFGFNPVRAASAT
jgi:hypothetical protein